MKKRFLLVPVLILGGFAPIFAQTYAQDPMNNIAAELAKISRSVTTLTEKMKVFVDKFEKVGGLTFTDKQQRLILGMELLMRTEQRVATFQKLHIELVEKQNTTKNRLTQVESDLRPRNIDRGVVFEGTTETEELRDSRRQRLQAERIALTSLLSQIQNNVQETSDSLREAQGLAFRLRRMFLPEIEREFYEQ